ncbi:response regulator [Oligoflexaceae bacterium]|nr:response regulator [Oligoflexaceae bacterium]
MGPTQDKSGEKFYSVFSPEDQKLIKSKLSLSKPVHWKETFQIRTVTGCEKWVRIEAVPSKTGETNTIRGTFQDVTGSHEREAFLDSLLCQLPKQVIYCDEFENVLFVNRDDIISVGKDCTKLSQYFPPICRDQLRKNLGFAKSEKTMTSLKFERDVGDIKYLSATLSPVFIKEIFSGYICVIEDETSLVKDAKELESQKNFAIQSSRLASIGQLAAGVGHEINNPLTIVSFALTQLKARLSKVAAGNDALEDVRKAEDALERAKTIATDLKKFSRADATELDSVDLDKVIEDTVGFISQMYQKEGITITIKNACTVGYARAEVGKLQQVILNLLANAKDAMDLVDEKNILIELGEEDDFVTCKISDNGSGVPDEKKSSIFDAFFTTKSVEKGTGLGLYICHSIVCQMGGDLRLVSDSKLRGACFEFRLQKGSAVDRTVVDERVSEEIKLPAKITTRTAIRKILIADDEQDILQFLADYLEEFDFEVTPAANGEIAWELFQKEDFDCVISDFKMPIMTGLDLFKKIRENRKANPPLLILASGAQSDEYLDWADIIVSKPFMLKELLAILEKEDSSLAS